MHPDRDSENSSEEEGFYANKIQIKEEDVCEISLKNWSKILKEASGFQSKYLPSGGVFRKEPDEVLKFQSIIPSEQPKETSTQNKEKLRSGEGQHPYKLYAKNEKYTLVYSRRRQQPILNGRFFLRNQVKLEHVGNSQLKPSKKIPSFDERDNDELYGALPSRPNILKIDSRFQCGNIHCAYKNKQNEEYILFIENDTNSLGYNQWFYFSVEDNKANHTYNFKIVNFKKKHSFYKYGAKPYIFSCKERQNGGDGWRRRGFNIQYEQSPIKVQSFNDSDYYCLSFDIRFQYENDYILIAMGLPYSYTKLTNFLKQLSYAQTYRKSVKIKINSVCKSIGGNDVPEVTITKANLDEDEKNMIIITARQHPGEVWSSYMMQGMIRHLLNMPPGWEKQKTKDIEDSVKHLLEKYTIKIFPMINVDGVIYGNFRCDLTGTDLNRRWKDNSRLLHPQVSEIKRRIRIYARTYNIPCCFDLHGHSKNFNVFCYSCKIKDQTCRILPLMISEKNPMFHFPYCTFGLSKYKETTARAALFKILRNENVLTIETSFFGSRLNGKIHQFSPKDIFKLASDIIDILHPFLDKSSKKYTQAKNTVQKNLDKYLSYGKEDDSGSESDPEADQIDLKDKLNQLFDSKYVNTNSLQIDNEVDDQFQEKVIKIREIEVKQEQKKIEQKEQEAHQPKKICANYTTKRPISLNRQFKTIQVKKQKRSLFQEKSPRLQSPQKITTKKKTQPNTIKTKEEQKIESPTRLIKTPMRTKTIIPKKYSTPESPELPKKQMGLRKNIYSSLHHRTSFRNNKIMNPIQISCDQQTIKKQDQQHQKFRIIHRNFNSAMKMSHKLHGALFDESIYNEDQSNLLSVLFNNKKILQHEKQKRLGQHTSRERKSRNKFRLQSGEKSQRMKALFHRSGTQLASTITYNSRRDE